jgi:hypothetical protein
MSKRLNPLLQAVTTVSAGAGLSVIGRLNVRTYQGVVAGTGTFTATVKIQGSNDNVNWIDLTSLSLSNTTLTAGYTSTDSYAYVRGNVTAVTGTITGIDLTFCA